MKFYVKTIAFGLLLVGGVTSQAMAAGTAAGTVIKNSASLSFQTETGQELTIASSPTGNASTDGSGGVSTDFKVDRKLDLEVAKQDAELVQVAPSGTAVLEFKVTNNGNDTQDVLLSALSFATGKSDTDVTAATGGGADSNDPVSTAKICTTVGTDPSACTGITSLNNLAADGTQTVYIVATMKGEANVENADLVLYSLRAQAADKAAAATPTDESTIGSAATQDNANSDDPAAVQNVFADAAGPGTDGEGAGDAAYDGYHSDAWAFLVVEANVSVTKESIAVWDPFSCDSDSNPATAATAPTSYAITGCTKKPKAIPGAYVEYTITIINAADAAPAESLSVTDTITDAKVSFVTDGYGAGTGIYVVAPYTSTDTEPTGTAHTNADDATDTSNFTASKLTSTLAKLEGGKTTKIRFRVLIQ